jgi:predicted aspartyl protease
VPTIEFPYTRHKGYFMPIVPLSIQGHKLWAFVDSGATFSVLTVGEAARIGIDWQSGRLQMIVVGDGSYIPTYYSQSPRPNR